MSASKKRTIVLDAQGADGKHHPIPPNVVVTERTMSYESEGKTHTFTHKDYRLPELGPTRVFNKGCRGPLVLPLHGRRFQIVVEGQGDDGIPEPGTVMFIETDEPETPYTLWDGLEFTRKQRIVHATLLKNAEKAGPEKGYASEHALDLERYRRSIKQHDEAIANGESLYHPNQDSAFGQPVYIQGMWVPVYEGQAPFHLLTFESGWGDAGNENYLVSLDAGGWPVAVFFEASCH